MDLPWLECDDLFLRKVFLSVILRLKKAMKQFSRRDDVSFVERRRRLKSQT